MRQGGIPFKAAHRPEPGHRPKCKIGRFHLFSKEGLKAFAQVPTAQANAQGKQEKDQQQPCGSTEVAPRSVCSAETCSIRPLGDTGKGESNKQSLHENATWNNSVSAKQRKTLKNFWDYTACSQIKLVQLQSHCGFQSKS